MRRSTKDALRALPLAVGLAVGAMSAAPATAAPDGERDEWSYWMTVVQQYYELLEDVHGIAESPQRTTILHMQKMREIHEDRGDMAAAADALRDVLERSSDPTVRNAARMMLVDVLRDTGRASEALRVIDEGIAENAGGR